MNERAAPEDALAIADAIATGILAELVPFRFGEAAGEAERMECFRLRYRALLEFDTPAAGRCTEHAERDEFDDAAVQIIGRDGPRTIATCRVVLPAAGVPLPMERAFGLTLPGAGAVVEWGRVVVDPDYRGDGHSIFMGLAAQGWLSMRARGYGMAVGATPQRLVALFEALGFAVEVLGPPRHYWGEERVPILCGAQTSVGGMAARWLPGEAAPSPPSEPPATERAGPQ